MSIQINHFIHIHHRTPNKSTNDHFANKLSITSTQIQNKSLISFILGVFESTDYKPFPILTINQILKPHPTQLTTPRHTRNEYTPRINPNNINWLHTTWQIILRGPLWFRRTCRDETSSSSAFN